MKIKTITKKIYITEDGMEFLSEDRAVEHEGEIREELKYTFYTVLHNFDTTEGRGWQNTLTIAVKNYYGYEKYIALQYLVDKFGRVLEYDIGGGPVPRFKIIKEDSFKTLKEFGEFKKSKVNDGIGDYRREIDREIIYLAVEKDKVFEVKTE